MDKVHYRIFRDFSGYAYWLDTYSEQGRVKKTFEGQLPKMLQPRILDAGCSLGHTTKDLLEIYPDADITGIDFDEETIIQARNTLPNCRFVHGDVYTYGFKEGFDISFFMNNLLFLSNNRVDLVNALKCAARTVKPNGYLALSADKVWAIFKRTPTLHHY